MLKTQDKEFTAFTADDILKAWLKALLEGLGPDKTFAPEIVDLNGATAKALRKSISDELDRRAKAVPPKTFDAAAFRASTRVAHDTGVICALMADPTTKVVSLDMFQKVRQLTKVHPACPDPVSIATGPFC